ncbi:MAG: GNAT family N-acetyltransferase [Lentisphaeria bacterium]|nr:GNAT family N-acetyltransferase [Lentisphaeria bacterium]
MQLGEVLCLRARNGLALTVRRLRPGDDAALQAFHAGLGPESERWFRAHSYDDATVRRVLERSEAGDDLTLGLFDGNRLVGYFFLWYFSEPAPLLGIGLVDRYQGLGLGRQLMGILLDEARAAGRDGVDLTTNLDNERAYALYEKLGFRHYRDVPNLQGDGAVVVERAMFYTIRPGAEPPDRPHRPPV